MLCLCTKISQPFKLSSSSRVEEEEEVAIVSFISVVENRVDRERRAGGRKENNKTKADSKTGQGRRRGGPGRPQNPTEGYAQTQFGEKALVVHD